MAKNDSQKHNNFGHRTNRINAKLTILITQIAGKNAGKKTYGTLYVFIDTKNEQKPDKHRLRTCRN